MNLPPPELTFYKLHEHETMEIRPASPRRQWMDETQDRYAYRCIPLSIANSSGWELLSPLSFDASWNGGPHKNSIKINEWGDEHLAPSTVTSHFGHGILTFHVPYLIQTNPGWALWVRGSPNDARQNIVPLDGLVETDWLPFTFTMNWRFTEPGPIIFEKGEPFCFVHLVAHSVMDAVEPQIKSINDNPELKEKNQLWAEDRRAFMDRVERNEPEAIKQSWQKYYVRGKGPDVVANEHHKSKLKLKGLTWEK